MNYTPQAGDLTRDDDGEVWFIYADDRNHDHLYAINAHYMPHTGGENVETVDRNWGPLTLVYRPEENPIMQ